MAREKTAAAAFGLADLDRIAALPGSEAGLRLLPRLLDACTIAVVGPQATDHYGPAALEALLEQFR